MIFRKDIEPRCAYCLNSSRISDTHVICKKRGVVDGGESCPQFKYDPLRRIPPRPAPLTLKKWTEEDFIL